MNYDESKFIFLIHLYLTSFIMLLVNKQLTILFQIEELQKLVHFRTEEVSPGPTAVQTQLVNKDGTFTDDFVFEFFEGTDIRRRIINCKFLPSPAATASIAIGEYVVEQFMEQLSRQIKST